MTFHTQGSDHPGDGEVLRGALALVTQDLVIGASPQTAVMRDGAARRMRRRAGILSGTAALVTLSATAVAAFGTGAFGTVRPAAGAALSPKGTSLSGLTAPSMSKDQTKDRIVVIGSGTFQGRNWRLVRDRFIVTDAATHAPAENLFTGEHLPFSDYGKPGTMACEALGLQFGDAAPGHLPDFDSGYACTPPARDGDEYPTPQKFEPDSFYNGMDKTTGAPTYIAAIGRGPAAGFGGSTAVSATFTVDGVTSAPRPLLTVPGEETAYYAFLAPGTMDRNPKFTVTYYDARGHEVGTNGVS